MVKIKPSKTHSIFQRAKKALERADNNSYVLVDGKDLLFWCKKYLEAGIITKKEYNAFVKKINKVV